MYERTAFLLAGILLGAIIKDFFDKRKEKRERIYAEKKEAYFGFLEACQNLANRVTPENHHKLGYWKLRCDLVGTPSVLKAINDFLSFDDINMAPHVTEQLQLVIKSDLDLD
ncbi:hypothetical protein [Halodesulfovibrio sp. MK-HDV]|jgi:hypothetical protein|uniref:hypothetical protein n=1 Tax=Halodesulfovibrio sp. MK-HDV TaxID=2599925 RepID=UPI001367E78B|nr:hypothetical protein [Halodesulfovibrio sp. MK-HDV]KAF1076291.1 hypothetical protein MKHDV_01312 [Halodesulfovibrio sp. MK-HDV]